jgi:hypothetical protein
VIGPISTDTGCTTVPSSGAKEETSDTNGETTGAKAEPNNGGTNHDNGTACANGARARTTGRTTGAASGSSV